MTQQTVPLTQDPNYVEYQKAHLLEPKIKRGINWFFVIGGLSMVNSVLYLSKADVSFIVGLGFTQLVDAFFGLVAADVVPEGGIIATAMGLGINMIVASLFIVAGILGRKRHTWAVIVGVALYLLDGVLLIVIGAWLEVIFHLVALWGLFSGLRAIYQYKKLTPPSATPTVPALP